MPRVSVIIPVYNHEQYLPTAIESALHQTYRDYEVIVVNDGSSDRSGELAERYAPNVRVVHQSNQGLSAARNTGIRHASGDYIALLDSDDAWLPDKLETQVGAMDAHPNAAMSHTDGLMLEPDGELKPTPDRLDPWPNHAAEHVLPTNQVFVISTMLRREAGEKVGWFREDLPVCEDWDLWVRLSPHGSFLFLPEKLFHYRLTPNSLSRSGERHQRLKTKFIEEELLPGLPALLERLPMETRRMLLAEANRELAVAYSSLGKELAREGRFGEAREAHGKALALEPNVMRYRMRYLRSVIKATLHRERGR